jgi:hypothetical protein
MAFKFSMNKCSAPSTWDGDCPTSKAYHSCTFNKSHLSSPIFEFEFYKPARALWGWIIGSRLRNLSIDGMLFLEWFVPSSVITTSSISYAKLSNYSNHLRTVLSALCYGYFHTGKIGCSLFLCERWIISSSSSGVRICIPVTPLPHRTKEEWLTSFPPNNRLASLCISHNPQGIPYIYFCIFKNFHIQIKAQWRSGSAPGS